MVKIDTSKQGKWRVLWTYAPASSHGMQEGTICKEISLTEPHVDLEGGFGELPGQSIIAHGRLTCSQANPEILETLKGLELFNSAPRCFLCYDWEKRESPHTSFPLSPANCMGSVFDPRPPPAELAITSAAW